MNLLVEYLLKELQELHENNIKINILGDYRCAPQCQTELEAALKKTRNNSGLTFSILNYGARHEILTAVGKLPLQWPAER